MPAEEIRLGPFTEGLNTFSDPTAISDLALAECVNFELDIDGSLVNRPPFNSKIDMTIPGGGVGYLRILGWYSQPGGVYRLIATDNVSITYYYNGTTWVLLANIAATAIVQYRDDLWLTVAVGSAFTGGKWNIGGGFTADANMPKGEAIISHKDRLWIAPGKKASVNGTRMYMSIIISAAVNWPVSPVFVNVGAGDGQNIVDLVVYNSDIIVFKEGSTYRFAFSSDPALGTITRISSTVGATDSGCYAEYQNQIFVLYDNKVYMFVNYGYEQLNSNVPLKTSSPSATVKEIQSISCWAERIIVQYYNSTYVYSLKTRTWSIWRSTAHVQGEFCGRYWTVPGQRPDRATAYFAGVDAGNGKIFEVVDAITANTETIESYFITKNYDYQSASKFKRLTQAGIDVIANVQLTIEAMPVSYANRVTWGQVALFNWGDLNTWGRLIDMNINQTDIVPVVGDAYGRKFVRANFKSFRFRQVAFKVTGVTMGDTATAPLRVFSLSTHVADKASTPKKIS